MENFVDYVRWRGDLSVDVVPFDEVDYAVFAQLIYARFEKLPMVEMRGAALDALYEAYATATQEKNASQKDKDILALWSYVAQSKRFDGITVENFQAIFDEHGEDGTPRQFAGGTFAMRRATGTEAIVVFRGTDSTLAGWREDLAMGYEEVVPAQADAAAYLAVELERFERVHVVGHSKGGNLALFAAVTNASAEERIVDVWNFDGPGMTDEVLALPAWEALRPRVVTLVPEPSIFGMIYGRGEAREVLVSDGTGAKAHSMFLWHVEGPRFVRSEARTHQSEAMARGIQEWLDTTARDERELFAQAMFKVAEENDEKDMDGLIRSVVTSLPGGVVLKDGTYTDEELDAVKYFVLCLLRGGRDEIASFFPDISLPDISLPEVNWPAWLRPGSSATAEAEGAEDKEAEDAESANK